MNYYERRRYKEALEAARAAVIEAAKRWHELLNNDNSELAVMNEGMNLIDLEHAVTRLKKLEDGP